MAADTGKSVVVVEQPKCLGHTKGGGSLFAEINKQLGLLPGFQGLNNFAELDRPEVVSGYATPLERVRREAEIVAEDVVLYFGREAEKRPTNRYCKTMRRTVRELSDRHDILFRSMINKLNLGGDDSNLFTTFVSVADEIFEDGQINWGRVVAVNAFAVRLADSLVRAGSPQSTAQKIALYTGRYVGNKLGQWILDNGGWEEFANFFPEQGKIGDKLWKTLFTAFGLGALTTAVTVH